MSNSKILISLCFVVAAGLAGSGCGTDHPDLKQGDQLGVDDLLKGTALDPTSQEGSGQLIGEMPSGNGGGGAGGTGGSGPAVCGNGVREGTEQCDGASLGPATCAQFGMSGGTLLCDPITCRFDDSMCLNGAGGVGGGAGN